MNVLNFIPRKKLGHLTKLSLESTKDLRRRMKVACESVGTQSKVYTIYAQHMYKAGQVPIHENTMQHWFAGRQWPAVQRFDHLWSLGAALQRASYMTVGEEIQELYRKAVELAEGRSIMEFKSDSGGDPYRRTSPSLEFRQWLDEQAALHASDPKAFKHDITPLKAEVILGRNLQNRNVKESVVAKYARDMRNGHWVENSQGIIIASDGSLNEGQHRLLAVIKSGKTIRMTIAFGDRPESRISLDQGATRNVRDYLAMEGIPNSGLLSQVARAVMNYDTYGMIDPSSEKRHTNAQVHEFVHANLAQLNIALHEVAFKRKPIIFSRGVISFVYYLLRRDTSSNADVDTFFEGLLTGAGLETGNPILYCRNRLVYGAKRGATAMNQQTAVELLLRTWNMHRAGKHITSGGIPIKGYFPEITA